ncbi:GyrI-like domain-containing protein [Aurantibacter sp.]|uniref:GyrI-like domain-containing protein n=1 Tax=Aurantibacter sp. TaxID=2807103 RepID=UPI0032640318
MEARIEELHEKLLIGKSIIMSLMNNKTHQLWNSFMKERNLVSNTIGTDLYSIQTYDESDYFQNFNPRTEFTKWATVEVKSIDNIPKGFNKFILKKGLYAVFTHRGSASEFSNTSQYIFEEWLPKSAYILDNRPHFEMLGEKYKNNDPSSEEEVWIPIKNKP